MVGNMEWRQRSNVFRAPLHIPNPRTLRTAIKTNVLILPANVTGSDIPPRFRIKRRTPFAVGLGFCAMVTNAKVFELIKTEVSLNAIAPRANAIAVKTGNEAAVSVAYDSLACVVHVLADHSFRGTQDRPFGRHPIRGKGQAHRRSS